VLSETFLHARGIGPVTERRIWGRGVLSWSDFLSDSSRAGLSPRMTERLASTLAESQDHLAAANHCFFSSRLPRAEHWRAYPEFAHRIAYLDIETTGLEEAAEITMIGVYDGRRVRTYIKGEDLQEFEGDCQQYGMFVTFFGSCFDLPFLQRRFPSLAFDQLHADLCWALRRLGLTGGLKQIETALHIPRSPETRGLDGWDAVRLWREWQAGSQEALALLKRYNEEDVCNLETLMQHGYRELRARLVAARSQAASG